MILDVFNNRVIVEVPTERKQSGDVDKGELKEKINETESMKDSYYKNKHNGNF